MGLDDGMTAWNTDKIYESIYQSTFIEVREKNRDSVWGVVWKKDKFSSVSLLTIGSTSIWPVSRVYICLTGEVFIRERRINVVISRQMWIWLLLGRLANLGWGVQPWLWLVQFTAHLRSSLIYIFSVQRHLYPHKHPLSPVLTPECFAPD